MRLQVTGYYQVEYLYTLSNQGILLTFKDYSIAEQNEMVALAAQKWKKWKALLKRLIGYSLVEILKKKKKIKKPYIEDGKLYLSGGKRKQTGGLNGLIAS